jgi:hypothetical protein
MREVTLHTVEHGGKRYVLVPDDDFEPQHSGCPEFGDADFKRDQDKLASGEWIAVGCRVYEPCKNAEHCKDCSEWVETDQTCWGFLVDGSTKSFEDLARDCF